jgi:hypothetical protein
VLLRTCMTDYLYGEDIWTLVVIRNLITTTKIVSVVPWSARRLPIVITWGGTPECFSGSSFLDRRKLNRQGRHDPYLGLEACVCSFRVCKRKERSVALVSCLPYTLGPPSRGEATTSAQHGCRRKLRPWCASPHSVAQTRILGRR